jgi:hypothetical protein
MLIVCGPLYLPRTAVGIVETYISACCRPGRLKASSMKRLHQSSGQRRGGFDPRYQTHPSVYEKDLVDSLLGRAISEEKLSDAQRLLLGKLITEVFQAKHVLQENEITSRITELEASHEHLKREVEHLNSILTTDMDKAHAKVNHLEGVVRVLQGEHL